LRADPLLSSPGASSATELEAGLLGRQSFGKQPARVPLRTPQIEHEHEYEYEAEENQPVKAVAARRSRGR